MANLTKYQHVSVVRLKLACLLTQPQCLSPLHITALFLKIQPLRWVAVVIYYISDNTDSHIFVWLMTSSRSHECLHILTECLFVLGFCSFHHKHPPSAGVEFNRLVLSDLQMLDSQGWLPWGQASFLGPSSSKLNFGAHVVSSSW